MNHKAELQQYCQRNKLALPIYDVHSKGPGHQLLWKASVRVAGKTYHSEDFFDTRKKAEQNIASVACRDIFNDMFNIEQKDSKSAFDFDIPKSDSNFYVPKSDSDFCVPKSDSDFVYSRIAAPAKTEFTPSTLFDLIDASAFTPPAKSSSINYQIFIDVENLQPVIPKNISLDNKNIHCILSSFSTVKDKYLDYDIHEIDSGASDAADYLLTFTAAELSVKWDKKNTLVIIVSRDKKLEILKFILESKGFKVTHYKTCNDFTQFLKSI